MIFGYKLTLPTNLRKTPDPVYTYDNYLQELRYKLQLAHSRAREHMLDAKDSNKLYYDLKADHVQYKVGDKVLLKNEQRKTKLHNPFIGPYEVTEIVSDVNIRIKIKKKTKIVHINRTKLFQDDKHDLSTPVTPIP